MVLVAAVEEDCPVLPAGLVPGPVLAAAVPVSVAAEQGPGLRLSAVFLLRACYPVDFVQVRVPDRAS